MNDPLAGAATLLDVLDRRARLMGDRPWLTQYEKDSASAELTFGGLAEGAQAWAARLREAGVEAGDRVLLVLPTERAFYEAFWGILLSGAVPVPAYPPVRLGRLDEYLETARALAGNCGARALATNELLRPLLRPLEEVQGGRLPLLVPRGAPAARPPSPALSGDDLALLQYTSGSTGRQKGVALTHANLLANLRAIGAGVRLSPEDVAVSWLPLYHDMGLIGLMLGTVYWGVPLVALSPVDFLRKPARWLRLLSDHRGTVTAGPNFAYSLLARKARDADLTGLDLSSCRVALCGAEPIYPSTIEAFTRRFAPFGFRPEAFFPAYGLAEATLAVSFSELDALPHVERLEAETLEARGRAVRVPGEQGGRALVSVGRPLPTVEVGIENGEGLLGEGLLGEVVVRGPSVMAGYFGDAEATAQTLRGGWLHTGDLGFLLDGRLFIAGRKKDLVIKAGRNYFAEDLEAAAASVPGVRPGGIAVFAAEDSARGTEEVVLVAEVAQAGDEATLAEELRRAVGERTGCRPDRVVLVGPRTLPKTSSGKVQRFKARQHYLAGTLGATERKIVGPWTYLKAWLADKLFRSH
ncbi:MAG: fatty acyl-AMP ligase [Deltaproteobacteria bacterium]|nr:fatty acyl-AMP ligase [Deltaproteobacteria bacterium]